MLDSWLPFLIYGILALLIPASMLGMSFWFSQKPARRTRARTVPFESYYTGYRTSVRQPDELITAIEFPAIRGKQWWRKVGTRRAQAISKIMLAAVRGPEVRLALGSVGPTVVLAKKTASK